MPTIEHILHHVPNDMLTLLAVGIGLAAIAIAALKLIRMTGGDKI